MLFNLNDRATDERECFIHGNESWSYAKLFTHRHKLISKLRDAAKHQPIVLWLGSNSPDAIALFLACAELKLWLCPAAGLSLSAVEFIRSRWPCVLVYSDYSMDHFLTPVQSSPLPPEGPGLLLRSSGTGGKPGLCLLPMAMIERNARTAQEILRTEKISESVVWSSLNHTAGWNIHLFASLLLGIRIHLHPGFNAFAALKAIKTLRHCAFHFTPLQAELVTRLKGWPRMENAAGHVCLIGSSDVFPRVIRAFREKNFTVIRNYGLTEVGPLVLFKTTHPQPSGTDDLDELGELAPDLEIRLEPYGLEDDLFHLCLKGRSSFAGYLGQPGSDDGTWFQTGDVVSKQGHKLYFEARAGDIFFTGGRRIVPNRLEKSLIERFPEIIECRISKSDDENLLICDLSLMPGAQLTRLTAEIQSLMHKNLGVRTQVQRVRRLNRTVSGKLLRNLNSYV